MRVGWQPALGPIVGAAVPRVGGRPRRDAARSADGLGVRTQSWDVSLPDRGPVLLEVNWDGDLNLAQLAYGRGVLDATYAAHLRANRYERRRARRRLDSLRQGVRRDGPKPTHS